MPAITTQEPFMKTVEAKAPVVENKQEIEFEIVKKVTLDDQPVTPVNNIPAAPTQQLPLHPEYSAQQNEK